MTNAVIARDVLLAAYENVAAWLAIAQRHREIADEAERMALATMAWVLAHPDQPADMSAHELRRLIAERREA